MDSEHLVIDRGLGWVTRLGISLLVFLGVYVFQMLGFPQPITGPVVNAALFAMALYVGPWHAAGVGLLTPIVAFARGILPAPLAPMIPFIAAGNALMVGVFFWLAHRRQPGLGVALSSAAKFALLAIAVHLLVVVPQPIAVMMQWPQLLTALGGGYIVVGSYHWTKGRRQTH